MSVEAQISKAREEAGAASANEKDLSSGSHDDDFKERVRAKWNEPAFQRGFKSFKKNFKKTHENDNTLIRVMFQFAKENSQNINVGRKCKHRSQITVIQSTTMARRTHRAVGRSVPLYGRREKVQEERRKQMVLDMKRFTLPSLQACHNLRREKKLTQEVMP